LITVVEKTGYKLQVHLKDYWPGKADEDLKEGSKALFYRNHDYLANVSLDDPKEVEFEFKECMPGEVLRIYFLDENSDDISHPDFCVSFNIKEYFLSGGKMVEDKHYKTNIALYDHEEDDEWNGNYGEDDFVMHGDEAVVQSHFKLKSFKYEVKQKVNAKPRAGRASRSPLRGSRGKAEPPISEKAMEGLKDALFQKV